MNLTGKTALVAGASSGIGAALALELARRGAAGVLGARRGGGLAGVADAIRGAGRPGPVVLETDLTDAAQVARLMDSVRRQCAGLDVLIYCAGVGQMLPLLDTSLEQVRRILEVNLVGAIDCIQQAVPLLRQRGGGRIVLVSSVAGLRGMPGGAVYSASKAALEGLADALRVELAPDGIGVQLVYPSLTRTEFFQHLAAGEAPSLDGKWAQGPEVVAGALADAIERGRRRSILSLKGRLIVGLGRLAPGLLDRLQVRRWKRAPEAEEPGP
jgi:short-subunit dehydrogenase